MISARFAPAVCVLLALALVPTVIHSYMGAIASDDLSTAAIPTVLAGMPSTPTPRDSGWGGRRFDSPDWIERQYAEGGRTVVLTVLRSYDHKRLYHHPEIDIADGVAFLSEATRQLEGRSDIAVRVLRSGGERPATAAYALHYDGRFVTDPIVFQLRTAGELLFGPRKPMTLFFARTAGSSDAALQDESVQKVLVAAVEAFTTPLPREATP